MAIGDQSYFTAVPDPGQFKYPSHPQNFLHLFLSLHIVNTFFTLSHFYFRISLLRN